MLMQSAVPSGPPLEQALRKYPSVVSHLIQKSARSLGDKEFKYANNFFIPSLYRKVQDESTQFYRSVIYGKMKSRDDADVDTVAIRRERLKSLIRERYKGIQANMVRDTGINAGELSALMRDKHFGEKKARSLEKQIGLPELWFDGVESQPKTALDDFQLALELADHSERSILLATVSTIINSHKKDERTIELPVIVDRRKKA